MISLQVQGFNSSKARLSFRSKKSGGRAVKFQLLESEFNKAEITLQQRWLSGDVQGDERFGLFGRDGSWSSPTGQNSFKEINLGQRLD